MRFIRCVVAVLAAMAIALTAVPPSAHAASVPATRVRLCSLPSAVPAGVERIGGADRFEVAVRVSQEAFPAGASVVFLASGANYADALTGSALAGNLGGPVLLVTRDSVPTSVRDEIVRLSPGSIVILGGPASVSNSLERSLAYLPASVERIAGADRYAGAVAVARAFSFIPVDVMYVASGEGFADALSASPAAGSWGVPVLLTTRTALPDPVRVLLAEQDALEQIVVVGGPATVSDSVVGALAQYAPVKRVEGIDRYAVSAQISSREFCDRLPRVYIASGENFPDALAGSVAAIQSGGPVLLVTRNSIPSAVATELRRLKPQHIRVLGGANTVSDTVVAALDEFVHELK